METKKTITQMSTSEAMRTFHDGYSVIMNKNKGGVARSLEASENLAEGLRERLNIKVSIDTTPISQKTVDRQLEYMVKHNEIRFSDFALETNSQYVLEAYNKMVKPNRK